MLLWGHPLMKLFVLIVWTSVSFLFEITTVDGFSRLIALLRLIEKAIIENC